MSIRIVSLALIASVTSLTGCAAELPQPGAPHSMVGFAVAGQPGAPTATATPTRTRIETPSPAPAARVMVFVRGPDAEPTRKQGGR